MTLGVAVPTIDKPQETDEHMYLRHIRNMLIYFTILVSLSVLASAITGIAIAAHAHAIQQQNNSSSCLPGFVYNTIDGQCE